MCHFLGGASRLEEKYGRELCRAVANPTLHTDRTGWMQFNCCIATTMSLRIYREERGEGASAPVMMPRQVRYLSPRLGACSPAQRSDSRERAEGVSRAEVKHSLDLSTCSQGRIRELGVSTAQASSTRRR